MSARALALALALTTAVRAQAPAMQVVELTMGAGGVTASGHWLGGGYPSVPRSDFVEDELPEGARWYLVLGPPLSSGQVDPMAEDGPPVLAKGVLCDDQALVEAEDARGDRMIAQDMTVPGMAVQLRMPQAVEARAVAVFRKGPRGAPSTRLSLLPVGGGGGGQRVPERTIAGGQTANRMHLQLLADGFTAPELTGDGLFAGLVEPLAERLLSLEPFRRYRHLLAVTAVASAAPESGVSLEDRPPRASAFGTQVLHARDGDRILTLPDGKPKYPWHMLRLSPEGTERLLRTNTFASPSVRALLVRDPNHTGVCLAEGTPSPVILLALGSAEHRFPHLLGHALANLGDEYAATPPQCDRRFLPCANVARSGEPVPWQWLIDAGALGATLPGGHLCADRYVHPRAACIMGRNSPSSDYCEACQSRLIEALYDRANLIDLIAPVEKQLTLDGVPVPRFRATMAGPKTLAVRAEWWIDHERVGPEFVPPARPWLPGRHVVRLLVRDATPLPANAAAIPFVRSFPHEARWDVHIRASQLVPLEPRGERFTTAP